MINVAIKYHMKRFITQLIGLTCYLSLPFNAFAQIDTSNIFLESDSPFATYDDVNKEAQAWGICSSVYLIGSEIFTSTQPATAKQYKQLSNGAKLAIVMTHVQDGLTEDIDPDRFNSLWTYSQSLMDSIPETALTMIMAEGERTPANKKSEFMDKIANTMAVCQNNLNLQQAYIDMWRELAKSGLLKLSESK
ncbi:hypothetical protein [Vibrio parahaemolyticus]|uniref:hypothetical protein n=1 Tax=Vibrio parahaemolyticus TaxID=670 RepID=UPI00046D8B4F|nr:hypothetical protein [Vibrio parahaemolyticus]